MAEIKNGVQLSEQDENIDFLPMLLECWNVFLKNWKWFLLSIVVCCGLAFLYLKKQPRVYQRDAVVLIEDEAGQGARRKGANSLNALMELDGVNVGDNLQNEIYILQSLRLMEEMVKRLNLDISYTTTEGLRKVAVYKDKPFIAQFTSPFAVPVSFDVEILSANEVRLSRFVVDKKKKSFDQKVAFGVNVQTPAGTINLKKEPRFLTDYIGKIIRVGRTSVEKAAMAYKDDFSAREVNKDASLINLTCLDINIDRAEEILETLLAVYKEDIVEGKNRVAANTRDFIRERLGLVESDLNRVESDLAKFKETNSIVDVQKNAEVFLAERTSARQESLRLESQVSVLEFLQDYLKNMNAERDLIPVLSGVGDASIQTQIATYNENKLEYNHLIEEGDKKNMGNPRVKILQSGLVSLQHAILASVGEYLNTTRLQLKKAKQVENALHSDISSVPEKEKRALDIQRQQAIKNELYVYLLNKSEEVELQLAITEANVRIVEYPYGTDKPISPKGAMIMLVGFVLALFIPSAYFWIKIKLDTSVRGRKDVENATTIPILGDIPKWNVEVESDKLVSKSTSGAYQISEAFRVLRYGLNFMKKGPRVMMLTSTTPGQGKTFVSRNLAVVLGMTGKKVVLVDADIRKRTQSKILRTGNGLTSYLSDENIHAEELIIKDGVTEGVDFMPAGVMPPNPAELLMSHRLDDLIEELRLLYDYVIIDTTPAFSVADANIVNRVVDLTLYVIRVGAQDRRFLPELERMYQEQKFRNLCIVLNGSVQGKYGYGYGYGYRYGYGYGYGHHESKSSKSDDNIIGKVVKKINVNALNRTMKK